MSWWDHNSKNDRNGRGDAAKVQVRGDRERSK